MIDRDRGRNGRDPVAIARRDHDCWADVWNEPNLKKLLGEGSSVNAGVVYK